MGETGANVLVGKLGIIAEDFLMRHARSKPAENIGDGDRHASNARAVAPLSGLDCYDVLILHRHAFPAGRLSAGNGKRSSTFCPRIQPSQTHFDPRHVDYLRLAYPQLLQSCWPSQLARQMDLLQTSMAQTHPAAASELLGKPNTILCGPTSNDIASFSPNLLLSFASAGYANV